MLLIFILTGVLATVSAATESLSAVHERPEHLLVERQRQKGGGGPSAWENWNDGTVRPNCKSGSGGSYTVSWTGNKGNFVCGKGWNTGEAK
jgi:endo-1,4-beta-xylanase